MTTDTRREMLELAARAMGITYYDDNSAWPHQDNCAYWNHEDLCTCGARWNPLDSDADCFAMETALELGVSFYAGFLAVSKHQKGSVAMENYADHANDKRAARRLAATRAAAEIGRRMK